MIRKYLDINYGTETQFIVRFYKSLPEFGDLSIASNRDRLVNRIAEEPCFSRWQNLYGFRLDIDQLKKSAREPTFRGLLDALFEQFAEFTGRDRWCDKFPGYTRNMPMLYSLYPEAQYVHMIRDGRDVALSFQKVSFGPKNVMQVARHWKDPHRPAGRRSSGLRVGPSGRSPRWPPASIRPAGDPRTAGQPRSESYRSGACLRT